MSRAANMSPMASYEQAFASVDWPIVAEILVAVGTLVLAAFTYGLARATRRLADEAVAARDAAERPWLVAYSERGQHGSFLVIENSGGSLATSCYATAVEYDPQAHQWLTPELIEGSELPRGVRVRRQVGLLIPGRDRSKYGTVTVRCRWRWEDRDRDYEQTYRVDIGLLTVK